VDDLYGLDRVDRWLNSGQGKQRSLLNWFQVFIMGCYLGMLGWFFWAFFASASLMALPVIALAAAVLAVPLRRLPPDMRARRSRRYPDKTGPEISWRWVVIASLFAIEMVLSAVDESVGHSLPYGLRDALALLGVVAALSVFPLLLMTYRYMRRYARARESAPIGLPAFENLVATPTHDVSSRPEVAPARTRIRHRHVIAIGDNDGTP
jgi:hypothetical protein